MKLEKEHILNIGENSYIQVRDLNETENSHITRESGEKDFKEYFKILLNF